MRARLLTPVLAAALLCLTACDFEDLVDNARYNRDFHYNYPMKPDGRLEVETFNGSVEISGWDQPTVDISGTKYGPTQESADSLHVDVGNSPEFISVRVVRPSDRRGNQGARLVIKIPRGVTLDRIVTSNGHIRTVDGAGSARLHTSNGSIHVQDLRGSLNAETSNGPVEVEGVDGEVTVHTSNSSVNVKTNRGDQPIRLESSNGPVDLSLGPNYSSSLRAHTSNSSITIHAPSGPNAHLTARTSNGTIDSHFDVRVSGDISKSHLDGTIGNGAGTLDLSTSNGSILLERM